MADDEAGLVRPAASAPVQGATPTHGLRVVELAPDLAGDYVALFDAAFRDNPGWDGCYCAFYDAPTDDPFDPEADGPRHREERVARIRSGAARGLLAYLGGRPVGWCNVGPRSRIPNLRRYAAAVEDGADDPAVIMCFVIDPDHRGRGVATALIRAAIEVARGWGSPWLEAYPAKSDVDTEGLAWTAASYKGTEHMYGAAGFRLVRDMQTWSVMRHDLPGR
jgi:GNAT superfamily N-acetyltransferase